MLIYNHEKKFMGIDESDLHKLGFKNLAELNSEVSDFANLFVKKPGYIHNFKHVHWIDFIKASDDNSTSRVTIKVKDKKYNATVLVKPIYLNDEPSLNGYIVYLQNLYLEGEDIYDDGAINLNTVNEPSIPVVEPKREVIKEVPHENNNYAQKDDEQITKIDDDLNIDLELDEHEDESFELDIGDEIDKIDIPDETHHEIEENIEIDLDNKYKDEIDIDEDIFQEKHVVDEPIDINLNNDADEIDNGYIYDPHIASQELGLPLDLVEEFIGDFILQAKDFKSELYDSLAHGNYENVKNLSHKLKGVAANLRIDDAFEYLAIINTSNNPSEIKQNLDKFYKVISKLSTKPSKEAEPIVKPQVTPPPKPQDSIEIDEDIFENNFEIEDSKVEDEIEIEDEEALNMKYYKQLVASELGLSDDIFNELLDDFIGEATILIKTIYQAAQKDDNAHWKKEAIKLKGMSENMRLKDFTNDLNDIIDTKDKEVVHKSLIHIKDSLNKISNK